jgi:hypothetical protein
MKGEEYHGFINFLHDSGEINVAQKNCYQHMMDMYFREVLVQLEILSEEHSRYLWGLFVEGKKIYKEKRNDS